MVKTADVKSKPQDEVIKRKQQDEWMRSRPSSVLSLSPVYVENEQDLIKLH